MSDSDSAMNPIKAYLDQLQQNLQTGQATEHTHRSALQILIQSLLPVGADP